MALTAVDLSLASKRIAVPTLDHDLILSNTAAAVGSRAGVASLLVIKNLLGGGGVTVSASAPISPASGNQWWDTSGSPDAGLKIRIGSSWVLVDDVLPSAVSQAQAEAGTSGTTRLWSPLRVAQAIAALASTGATGANNADIIDARIVSWALRNSPTGHAPINRGGTGANTASGARTSLGLGTAATRNTGTAQGDVVLVGVNDLIVSSVLAAGATDNTDCLRGNRTWGPINHPIVTQAEAEAGTVVGYRTWSPQRVSQAIAALAAGGGSGGITISATAPTGASNGDLWWDTSGHARCWAEGPRLELERGSQSWTRASHPGLKWLRRPALRR